MGYRFGDCELSPERYELRRGDAAVALEPRVAEVLAYLVRHGERVVSKDELLDRLWAGQAVTEWVVTRAIRGARQALRRVGTRAPWIRTVYGRGFVFAGRVCETTGPSAPALAAADPPARLPALASVAVLSFADLSPGRDQGYFCEGLAQEVVDSLARIEGLSVASRTSTAQFRDRAADIRTIAERTNTASVLEGSVRKDGGRLRVSVQLVNASDNYHLWSTVFDRRVEAVFAIQQEIAQSVARALRVVLTDRERLALRSTPPAGLPAYDCYLRGRRQCGRPTGQSLEAARQMYLRAIELDPGYAAAHAGLADCSAFLYFVWGGTADDLALAVTASRRAVQLGPDLAEAHVARAQTLAIQGDPAAADEAFGTALRLKPRLAKPHYLYARFCYASGRLTDAVHHFERAEQLSPDDERVPLLLARAWDHLGRREAAADARRRGVALAEQRLEVDPLDPLPHYYAAGALVALGQRQRGLEWAARALALSPDDQVALTYAGAALIRGGRVDEGLACLERAVKSGFRQRRWFALEPDLAAVRRHPRLRALLAEPGSVRPAARRRAQAATR
jgi:adenylate cyclase